jgi:hypothetical protein
MTESGEHLDASEVADPTDRGYVESMPLGAERDVVIASLTAYRAPDALRAGDPLPDFSVRRAADLEPVALHELHRGRPLLLVFGSFT